MEKWKRQIIDEQLDFYKEGLAGCKFAQYAAQNPESHFWKHDVFIGELNDDLLKSVENFINYAETTDDISTVSLIFPEVKTEQDLARFLNWIVQSERFFLEPDVEIEGFRCIHLRVNVDEQKSWVSGFAPLNFMPLTRQSPYTEIVFRVKKRPDYKDNIQPKPPKDEIHVADMEMPGMSKDEFTKKWRESFVATKERLGHDTDELSAAKVTYILPVNSESKN